MLLITDKDFNSAWARAVRGVLREGKNITIGSMEEPKPIRDVTAVIELTGNAIKQIENREIHSQFPFKYVDQYCDEFTYEFQSKYLNAEDETLKFTYTYFDRLVNHRSRRCGKTDQLKGLYDCLKIQIETNIPSNRCQATTWQPDIDLGSESPPCLQRIWIRYLGNNEVEVYMNWRSRDLFTAYQANIIAIIDMLNREVIRPNNCRIVRLVEFIDSLHIYDSDRDAARGVKLVPVNPQG